MQRITNITAIFACLVIGTALLVSNIIGNTAIPQTAKVKEKKVGDLSNKEMAKLYGGVNNQCWQSENNCASVTSATCNNDAKMVLPGLSICDNNTTLNNLGGKYYFCAMGDGDNDQHCGTSSTVYCKKRTTCLANIKQGETIGHLVGGQLRISCQEIDGYSLQCGQCANGGYTMQDGHSSIRCVPNAAN